MTNETKAREEDLAYFLRENPKYEKLQWVITQRLKLCKTPLQAAIVMNSMMVDYIIEAESKLNSLVSGKKCDVIQIKVNSDE